MRLRSSSIFCSTSALGAVIDLDHGRAGLLASSTLAAAPVLLAQPASGEATADAARRLAYSILQTPSVWVNSEMLVCVITQIGARRQAHGQNGGNIGCAGNESDRRPQFCANRSSMARTKAQRCSSSSGDCGAFLPTFDKRRADSSSCPQGALACFARVGMSRKDDGQPERLTDALRRQAALQQRPAAGVNRLMRAQPGGSFSACSQPAAVKPVFIASKLA